MYWWIMGGLSGAFTVFEAACLSEASTPSAAAFFAIMFTIQVLATTVLFGVALKEE